MRVHERQEDFSANIGLSALRAAACLTESLARAVRRSKHCSPLLRCGTPSEWHKTPLAGQSHAVPGDRGNAVNLKIHRSNPVRNHMQIVGFPGHVNTVTAVFKQIDRWNTKFKANEAESTDCSKLASPRESRMTISISCPPIWRRTSPARQRPETKSDAETRSIPATGGSPENRAA